MNKFDEFLKAYEEEIGRETDFNEHAIAKLAWMVALKSKTDGGAEVALHCGVMCSATNGGRKLSRQYHEQQENLKNGECILCRKPLLTKRHCKECAEKVRILARNRYRKKVGIKLDAPLCGPRRKRAR